jgi:hypothetical protein
VKSKFVVKIVSVSNLPDPGGFYRIEWKRSSVTGRTQTFVPTHTAKPEANIQPNTTRHCAELVDEENIAFDLITTQDSMRQFSKKEMSFTLKLKDGQKSKLLGTGDVNLSDYIPRDGKEQLNSVVEVHMAPNDEIVLKLSIEAYLAVKKKKGADSLSSSASADYSSEEASGDEGSDLEASPRHKSKASRRKSTKLTKPPTSVKFVVEVCKITGLNASKFQPNAQFFVKCRSEHSTTLGETSPIGPLVSPATELRFDPPHPMTLLNVDCEKERVTFAIYSQLSDKEKAKEGKAEAFAKAKLTLAEYLPGSGSTLTDSPTRVVLTMTTQKDTLEGMPISLCCFYLLYYLFISFFLFLSLICLFIYFNLFIYYFYVLPHSID